MTAAPLALCAARLGRLRAHFGADPAEPAPTCVAHGLLWRAGVEAAVPGRLDRPLLLLEHGPERALGELWVRVVDDLHDEVERRAHLRAPDDDPATARAEYARWRAALDLARRLGELDDPAACNSSG